MRGLTLFILDIRKCRGKEEELKRINKELANIRFKFKGDKPLNGYDKKKYVCKLIFMFLLGHKCDMGHIEAINLLSSNVFTEKRIGYLFISVVMRGDHNFVPLLINAIKNDLACDNKLFQNLALQFISNNANKEMAEALSERILELLTSVNSADFVKQTAALTFLQLLRVKPDIIPNEKMSNRIIHLLSHHNFGVVTASASLLDFLTKHYPLQYNLCLSHVISRLSRIVTSPILDFQDYNYYFTAAPWLTVKLFRILQNYSVPEDASLRARLRECLELTLNKAQEPQKSKKFEHSNAKFAIIFESISLILHMDFDNTLLSRAINILGSALNQKEPNLRFMALELMAQFSNKENLKANIMLHWGSILNTLKTETDISIRKSAINLLYCICDETNVKEITEEILYFLEIEDESLHEEVILKTAVMAEQFNKDLEWYVDTIINMLQMCTDNVNENVWYTLIKVIIDNDKVQEYAARAAYAVLHQIPCPDIIVKVAGYILGEFGYLIAKDPRCGHLMQLNMLKEKYSSCAASTRALLLTTYMKFLNLYPELKTEIQSTLKEKCNTESANEEIQQRAIEYLKLSQIASKSLLATILEEMPSCKRQESAVVEELEKRKSQILNNTLESKKVKYRKAISYRSRLNIRSTPETERKELTPIPKSKSQFNLHRSGASANLQMLLEVFHEIPTSPLNNNPATLPHSAMKRVQLPRILPFPSNERFLHYFLFNEEGTLFENDDINIFLECEFMKHFGRFHLTYTNKSSCSLSNFSVEGNFSQLENKCSIWFKPKISTLKIAESLEQDIQLECLNEFSIKPSLIMKFSVLDGHREIKLVLPLTMNKFVEPSNMTPEMFIKRWCNLGNLETVKEFNAKYPMIHGLTQQKLKSFRVSVIENVEPNSEHFYCAGIFYVREFKIGFLVRLERHVEENKYRMIIRSTQQIISENISNLLQELL